MTRGLAAHGIALTLLVFLSAQVQARAPLVLLTDFGTADGSVSAVKGVVYSVSEQLLISDLSHENPSIIEGAYRLYQRTFGEVPVGQPLVYSNSLLNVPVALNRKRFAAAHQIESGPAWTVEISRD